MSKGRGSAREGWVRHHQQRSQAKPRTEKEAPPPKPIGAVTTSQAIELVEAEASLSEALLAHFEQQETCLEDALVALSALPAAPAIDHGDLERENREASERRAQRAAKFGTGHTGSQDVCSPQLDAFEAAFLLCEARELLPPDSTVDLSNDVPRLLRQAFDQDFEQLMLGEKVVTNVTCMQPADEGCGSELFSDELLKLALKPGRVCEGGACGEACSRVAFPRFASRDECEAFRELLQSSITPPLHHFELAKCAFRSLRTTLVFVRLVERMRRAIAHEYGLPLATVVPAQAFVACLAGAQEKKQGGLHADESSFPEFHYSCVLYLSTHPKISTAARLHSMIRRERAPAPPASPRTRRRQQQLGCQLLGAPLPTRPLAPSARWRRPSETRSSSRLGGRTCTRSLLCAQGRASPCQPFSARSL